LISVDLIFLLGLYFTGKIPSNFKYTQTIMIAKFRQYQLERNSVQVLICRQDGLKQGKIMGVLLKFDLF